MSAAHVGIFGDRRCLMVDIYFDTLIWKAKYMYPIVRNSMCLVAWIQLRKRGGC